MKIIVGITLTASLLLFSAASGARGTPSSSFVPRGPEPHSSLSDKHHARHGAHASSHHGAAKVGKRPMQHSARPN